MIETENALVCRDKLFSRLHTAVLKSNGFKKSGHWSVKSSPPFHWAVYLRASRFGTSSEAIFWLDLTVFHEDFTRLVTGARAFPGCKESTLGLVNERLGEHCSPRLTSITIDASTDIAALEATLTEATIQYALPLFEKCHDLENVLDYYARHPRWPMQTYFAAGAALLLNREAGACRFFALERQTGNGQETWFERRELAMRQNLRQMRAIVN
jgi:hypothetical protein